MITKEQAETLQNLISDYVNDDSQVLWEIERGTIAGHQRAMDDRDKSKDKLDTFIAGLIES